MYGDERVNISRRINKKSQASTQSNTMTMTKSADPYSRDKYNK